MLVIKGTVNAPMTESIRSQGTLQHLYRNYLQSAVEIRIFKTGMVILLVSMFG